MYSNQLGMCKQSESMEGEIQRSNLTVLENIDLKIAMLQSEIVKLEASKQALTPLLNMKIRDIREAMNY